MDQTLQKVFLNVCIYELGFEKGEKKKCVHSSFLCNIKYKQV